MTGDPQPVACVDWSEPDRWAALVDARLTLHDTAIGAMRLCETRLGPLRWELDADPTQHTHRYLGWPKEMDG